MQRRHRQLVGTSLLLLVAFGSPRHLAADGPNEGTRPSPDAPSKAADTAVDDVLEPGGSAPKSAETASLRAALCRRSEASTDCDPGGPEIGRLYEGSFTTADASERVVSVTMADGRRATAVLRDRRGEARVAALHPGLDTRECLSVSKREKRDLLVCHRAIEDDVWRTGFFYTLRFEGDETTRRQLASYRSNARGCPRDVLRTEHPTGWGAWQVDDDPRPPLVWIGLVDRNGDVPDGFDDACDAMGHGRQVFGRRRQKLLRFEWRDGRFRRIAPRRSESGRAPSESEGDFCRTDRIRRTVQRATDEIRTCYRREVSRHPASRGRVTMTWKIDLDGTASQVSLLDEAFEGDAERLGDCIAGHLRELEYQKPRGGSCLVEYPFEFGHE